MEDRVESKVIENKKKCAPGFENKGKIEGKKSKGRKEKWRNKAHITISAEV